MLKNPYSISLMSGCSLFSIYTSRLAGDKEDFGEYKKTIVESADKFAKMSLLSRSKICEVAHDFVRGNVVIFTHGHSRAVCSILREAAVKGRLFKVIISEGKPSCNSYETLKVLLEHNIQTEFVLDAAMAVAIEKSDFVLVGAEGVAENGGIVSQLGTLSIAIITKTFKKPFYVAAESYKFTRFFPLHQSDIQQGKHSFFVDRFGETDLGQKDALGPNALKHVETLREIIARTPEHGQLAKSARASTKQTPIKVSVPTLDYTAPEFISSLFTDLGAMNTSAVSEQLIKLYY